MDKVTRCIYLLNFFLLAEAPILVMTITKLIKFIKGESKESVAMKGGSTRQPFRHDNTVLFAIIITTLFIVGLWLFIRNSQDLAFLGVIIKNTNFEFICNTNMAVTAMVLSMALVVILMEKRFYLVFSMEDVLNSFNSFFWIKSSFFSCILTVLSSSFLLLGSWNKNYKCIIVTILEIASVFNFVSNICSFNSIAHILFSSDGKELRLLDRLYRCFRYQNFIARTAQKNWSDTESIKYNFEYLMYRYTDNYKNVNISKFSRIKYISWQTSSEDEKELIKNHAQKKYKRICWFFGIVSFIIMFKAEGKYISQNLLIKIEVLIVIILLDILFSCNKKEWIREMRMDMFADNAGYQIGYSGKKDIFIGDANVYITNRKYVKYIRSVSNLVAFTKIALDSGADVEKLSMIMEEYMGTTEDELRTEVIKLLPFWTTGYLMFQKGHGMNYLQDIAQKLSKKQKKEFEEMVEGQINFLDSIERKGDNEQKKMFLGWLKGRKEIGK